MALFVVVMVCVTYPSTISSPSIFNFPFCFLDITLLNLLKFMSVGLNHEMYS